MSTSKDEEDKFTPHGYAVLNFDGPCSPSRSSIPTARSSTKRSWPSAMPINARARTAARPAARALGNHRVADAVAKVRAIIGPANIPDSEPLAQSALGKLHNGEVPDGARAYCAGDRCAAAAAGGALAWRELDDLPDQAGHNLYPPELKDIWSKFRTLVKPLLPSIGRVETKEGKHIGTGFLVADKLLATNRHVLGALTFGAEVLRPGVARVVFKQEVGLDQRSGRHRSIEGVAAIHPKLDMVLLTVAAPGRSAVEIDDAAVTEGHAGRRHRLSRKGPGE